MVSVAEEVLRNASDLSQLKISTPTVIKLIETGHDNEACVSFKTPVNICPSPLVSPRAGFVRACLNDVL